LTLSLFATLALSGTLAPPSDGVRVPLETKVYRTWRTELPRDPFQTVSGRLPIPHAGGAGFAVEARGQGLALDTDGDGTLDRVIEGVADAATGVASARVTLTGERPGGARFKYPVRLEGRAGAWRWAPGGGLEGRVGETEVALIDLDGNGVFGDVGGDAVVVGGGDVAMLLGEALLVDGVLHRVAVDPNGAHLELTPFTGPTGVLDLRSALATKAVLLAAVVQSVDGRHSFELASVAAGARIPVGEYRLLSATLGLGESRVRADGAAVAPLLVAEDGRTELAWGAPVSASFGYERKGLELVFDPNTVSYVGRAGERWIGWDPIGKSPSFRVKEKTTGEVLVDFVFPGSC